ncbi:O-antigen ligase family protein [Alkalihalobacillus sp. CinArs1]|uniref:O-antigen ligase family protein n=1 Tax=Alkalihalobacillus sp. CinArs1 TaxID=2995314 RepID=UPI0022DD7A37|nr:O-antigen ligase family protein [Alkalihalobacillus sp. CinArs1]
MDHTLQKLPVPLILGILFLAGLSGLMSTVNLLAMVVLSIPVMIVLFYPISIERLITTIALVIFIDVSFIVVSGSYIRIYQLLLTVVCVKLVIEYLLQKRQLWKVPLFFLINLWVLSYFLSYQHVLSMKDFWVSVIGQLFLNLFFFISVQCIREKELPFFMKIVKFTILSGFIVVVVGILQWIGFFLGIHIGISHYDAIGIPRPSSFAYEPDWFGLFAAYTSIWFLALFIRKDTTLFSEKFVQYGMALSFLGIFISMARASIVAFIFAGLYLLVVTKNIRILKMAISAATLVMLLLVVLFAVDQNIFKEITNRFNPATSVKTDRGAADSRLGSIELMWDYIQKHPIVGNGSGGMALLSELEENKIKYAGGGDLNTGKGNANIFLSVLFDTGVVGLAIFLLIISRIIWMLKQTYNKNDFVSLGLIGCSILVLVNFNFNNGFRMGFVWFHLALVVSYFLLKKQKREEDREIDMTDRSL